ncbi:MAG: hypothetical protein HDR81_00125 [Bacteroides sp.]|nr:hypothetical protein [Bacteroides sp.]
MTIEQIKLSFQLAVDVYSDVKTLKEAKEIGESYGIKPASMNYYCTAYRHMMNGTEHTGSIGTDVREYFLSQIFSKCDNKVKRNALIAFEQTIEYDEARNHCTLHKNRSILEKYKKFLSEE